MKTAYYETKAKIMALATGYLDGDEETRAQLRKQADFFPLERSDEDFSGRRSMMMRIHGEIFLVEDTMGGETGVFALLLPIM
ncbi:MAG: hypothetical protein V4640_06700 [Verrucomicrobiota bacterium]